MKGGKVCVLANGCPENRIDSARVMRFFEKNGWIVTEDHRMAYLIVFDACGFTEGAVKDSLNIISKVQREKKEGSKLVVWGCLPKIDPESLMRVYNGPVFGEKQLGMLNEFVGSNTTIEEVTANRIIPKYTLEKPGKSLFSLFIQRPVMKYYGYLGSKFDLCGGGNPSNFYIKVATGCAGNCTFCAIRKSRGYIRSKSIEKVMCEFREGLRKGFKRFSLLGTDLGPYGIDLGYTLVDLLEEMTVEEGDYEIALRNMNPFFLRKMLDRLVPIFRSGKIWYMGCAAESGSNRILKLMNRRYTVEEFKECMQAIHGVSPETVIRTQMIVGFPTETEQDFEESMCLLDEVVFDFVDVYKFSRRSGTPASIMQGQVTPKIVDLRFRKLTLKYLFQRIARKVKMVLNS